MSGIIHEAGEPVGLVQTCVRCGKVLSDYTNAVGYGDWKPTWWNGTVTFYPGNPEQQMVGIGKNADLCKGE